MTNLPLQAFAKNEIWLELVPTRRRTADLEPAAGLAPTAARTWEPQRLRLRLLALAVRIITTGRRRILRLSRPWPWTT